MTLCCVCTRCMGRLGSIKDLEPIILDSQGQASAITIFLGQIQYPYFSIG